jgi:hypothetical protein
MTLETTKSPFKHVVIVTGSRQWTDQDAIESLLENAMPDLVVQGGARGADEFARLWCAGSGVPCKTFHANWKALGRRAGIERNTRMLLAYPGAVVLAFPLGGPGTRHCMREAQRLGMRLHAYKSGPDGPLLL